MNKKELSERDICTRFITPALRRAGWNEQTQLREEVTFTKGRVIVRGRMVSRGKAKRADYVLYFKPNIPLAVIEAKDNHCSVGDGIQQALDYATTLKVPFAFSSNGDGFVFHDRTVTGGAVIEKNLSLDDFPSPATLWARYRDWQGLPPEADDLVLQDYFSDGSGKGPRYYQATAVNAATEAIAKGQQRLLLAMATGTGKTYTAFQIIWRLWKAGRKKRILFLADRNILVDQTMVNDFRPFGAAMAKLSTGSKVIEREDGSSVDLPLALDKKRRIDTSYEIYLALYQAITGPEDRQKIFRELSRDFFDLIVVDECHRGSAAEDSAWREILEHFSSATQIGMTATPKETKYISNIYYFGKPVYSYSLKQGIQDGFLAPYKVIKVHIDRDIEGYRPEPGKLDRDGNEVEDRIYDGKDFDRTFVIDERTQVVARKIIRSNGSLNLVGRAAVVGAEAVGRCYAGYLVRVRISEAYLDPRCLLLVLNSEFVRQQIELPIRTTVGLKNVNSTELSRLSIPLPPLTEQQEIVGRVDELMAICDRLEAQLATARTESSRLLEAVLHKALEETGADTREPVTH